MKTKRYYQKIRREINKVFNYATELGYKLPTQSLDFETKYSRVIKPNNILNSGQIKTYYEALSDIKKAYGESYYKKSGIKYTYDIYLTELSLLSSEILNGRTKYTIDVFLDEVKIGYINIAKESLKRMGYDYSGYNFDEISVEELKTIVMEADRYANQYLRDSASFASLIVADLNYYFGVYE